MKYYDPKARRRKTTILTSRMDPDDDPMISFGPNAKTTILTNRMAADDDAVFDFDPNAKSTIATAGLGPNDNELRAKARAALAARDQLAAEKVAVAKSPPDSTTTPKNKPDAERQEKEKRNKDCEEWGKVVENQVKEIDDLRIQMNEVDQQIARAKQIIIEIRKEQLGRPPRSAEEETFIPKPKDIEKDTPKGRRGRGGRPAKNFVPWAGLGRAQNRHARAKEKAIAEVEKRIEKLHAERTHLETRKNRKTRALPDYDQRYRACLEKNAP